MNVHRDQKFAPLYAALGLACLLGCSNAEFGASVGDGTSDRAATSGTDRDDERPDTAPPLARGDDDGLDADANDGTDLADSDGISVNGAIDSGTIATNPPEIAISGDELRVRRTECWFAVSGGYLGGGQYNSSFPSTSSGRPIGHGEAFDDVGGVFLVARDEAYVFQEGGKEIDTAVGRTFDSIAVAPGMHVDIRDAGGGQIFEGDGPAFLYSSDYGNHQVIFQASAQLQLNLHSFPPWMQTIIKDHNYIPPRTSLHAARSVRVSKIPGQRCDF